MNKDNIQHIYESTDKELEKLDTMKKALTDINKLMENLKP